MMRVHLLILVVSVLTTGTWAVGAQSLAEVARKEEERRKAIKAPSKVYTNQDLGRVLPAPPVPASGTPPPAPSSVPGAPAPEAAEPKEPPKDQAYWAGRMRDLQGTLERDQTYVDALQSRVNALTTDFVNRDDPAQQTLIARDRQRAIAELDRLTKAIAGHKKAIADLEEEARRAGVPPGWLR